MRPPATATAVAADALLPAAPLAPGEQSHSLAQLEAQLHATGTTTVCCVALKPPGERKVLLLGAAKGDTGNSNSGSGSNGKRADWQEADMDDWLHSLLIGQGWRGWVCYNDAPPSFRPGSRFGHCKGILAWRTDRLGWLVHSVPEWPEVLSDRGVTALPKSAVKNGQSFVWLSLPRSDALTKAICSNLVLMNPCTFNAVVTTVEERNVWPLGQARFGTALPVPPSQPPSCIQLAPGVWHLAKHGGWSRTRQDGRPVGLDFYEDALAQTEPLVGFWHAQTWLNGKADVDTFGPTASVDNIVQMRLPDRPPHSTRKDHSKWAVRRGGDKPLVLVGDLNRTSDQTKRGGGGVVIQDEGMWQALTSLVTELEGSGPQVASAQLPLCFTQQATLSVQTPMQPARRPRQRTGAFAASGSGMAALTQGVGSSLHAIGGRPMSTAVGMSAGSEGARARSTGDVVDGDISSSTGGGMRELDEGQVQFSDASRAEASDGSRGEVVVPVDGSQSTASSASGNGVAPARASGGSTCAAGDAGNGAEPALSSNGTNKAAGDAASTGADGSSSAAKRCSCRPENCGKGRCSCKAHTCSQLCGCKGLCAFTVQALQAAQHANAAAVLAPGQAPGEDAAAAAAAAVCLLPAEGEASPLRAAVAAAELSAGVPTTPEPERATPPAVAVESAEPLRVAAVAAGLGNLMQSAAMASALSAAAPAAHLLHDHQAADSKQGHKDGGAGGANSGSAAGSGAIAADSAVGASPGAAKACKCSPGNCGRAGAAARAAATAAASAASAGACADIPPSCQQ